MVLATSFFRRFILLLLFMFGTYVSLLPLLSRYVYDTHTHTDTDKLRFIAINDLGCFVVWFPRHQSSAYALINFFWNFVLLFWGFSRFLFIYLFINGGCLLVLEFNYRSVFQLRKYFNDCNARKRVCLQRKARRGLKFLVQTS